MSKVVKSIEIIAPGSSPDIDTDFHTKVIGDVLEHLRENFGAESVSNISTQSKLQGKSAFKQICTIYEIPFAAAQKVSEMIPTSLEGQEKVTIKGLLTPGDPFYEAGAEFRTAVSDTKWEKVLEGALAIEGRTKALGTHACGVIVSSSPIANAVPMMVDRKTGIHKTQWNYPQLEDLGLIKFDLLGLDTINLIHLTLQNIIKSGKTPPNIIELFNGSRDDKETYEMLGRGETEGVFQLASCLSGDTQISTESNPTSIEDLYRLQEDGGKLPKIPATYFRDGSIRLSSIAKVVRSGRKALHRISTSSPENTNHFIDATERHRFFREGDGWVKAKELTVGDKILVSPASLSIKAEISSSEWDSYGDYAENNLPVVPDDCFYEEILSITELGVEETYDISMKGEAKNFIANGYVVHNSGMKELLRRMNPREFNDIVAVSALYRPGPMGTNSHTEYAERRAGRAPVKSLHPAFAGSKLDDILRETQGILIYQEQVMQIANQVAGMTLQEGDDLRKAMGKKKASVMDAMKPKFLDGGVKNGYPVEAMEYLWGVMEPFSSYAFNKAHSVAYGLNTYATAFLKAHYPVEFMAALIAQSVKDRDKVKVFLKELDRMGLTMGSININSSDVSVAPDFTGDSGYDILYGIGGINSVTVDNAEIIVKERNENGPYLSVQDVIERCESNGLSNRRTFQNLALAGAFDTFGNPRKQIVENLDGLIKDAKRTGSMGMSLFDVFETNEVSSVSLDGPEYDFAEKMRLEAGIVGMSVSDHPLSHLGKQASNYLTSTIEQIEGANKRTSVTLIATIISKVEKKNRKGSKIVKVVIDDGTGFLQASLSRNVVAGLDKMAAQLRTRSSYENKENKISAEALKILNNHSVLPLEEIQLHTAYLMDITYRPNVEGGSAFVAINNMKPISVGHNGSLPLRVRIPNKTNESKARELKEKLPKALAKRFPGDTPILVCTYENLPSYLGEDGKYIAASEAIQRGDRSRGWPPRRAKQKDLELSPQDLEFAKALSLDSLEYEDSGYTYSPCQEASYLIERLVGVENYDYGTATTEVIEAMEEA